MVIFADTSGLYAVLDAGDANHQLAARVWQEWLDRDVSFVITNYVVVELLALIQRRLGPEAVRDLVDNVMPMLDVEWIDADVHGLAMRVVVLAGHRGISLVDAASFEVMRRRGLNSAFTFDHHFSDERFDCLPERDSA